MSFIAPRLPENAPFSPLQRAWLDGYLAALLGDDSVAPATPIAAEAAPEPETFPWHDPGLPLDERLALAAGRRPERVYMAAMAQTDCGQCGYQCRTYAEAIASGAETDLGRCAPGGRATARKLKELAAEFSAGTATVAPVPAAAATPLPSSTPAAPSEPFPARLREAQRLNRDGSDKDTRLVVLETDATVPFEVGDSLGVTARNCPELVAAIIARLGARADTPVLAPDGTERPLIEALTDSCEIRQPSDRAIEVLASRAHDIDESRVLQAMAEGYPGAGPDDADLLDLLEAFPSATPPLSELISALDPLRPRLYSIASSPKHISGEVHLTVAAIRYEKRARRRTGVASTYLSDRLAPGDAVSVHVHPAEGFRLPAPDAPVIMIGPGTGIAPFRAFLQERQAIGAHGRNWLFFGNPHRDRDFLFEEELAAFHRDGLLTRFDTAFSRDQEHKVYVQHRLLDHAGDLWAWLEEGAHLYVCGDAQRMARDVDQGLTYIVAKKGRMPTAAAKAYVTRLAAEGRYQRDVY
ncbi:MAG TPA: sulfite reductase subunit alpha [Stellaceae bacterium]|jgi:sulfite reductase (NADPH) flavoprotein alpha-component|nr:sulfite reductase subunit alpha [Stellaceae bacterium]